MSAIDHIMILTAWRRRWFTVTWQKLWALSLKWRVLRIVFMSVRPSFYVPKTGDVSREAVGFREGIALVMPFGTLEGVGLGCKAEVAGYSPSITPDDTWLGRVINALGEPLDGKGPLGKGEFPVPLRNLHPGEGENISGQSWFGGGQSIRFWPRARGNEWAFFLAQVSVNPCLFPWWRVIPLPKFRDWPWGNVGARFRVYRGWFAKTALHDRWLLWQRRMNPVNAATGGVFEWRLPNIFAPVIVRFYAWLTPLHDLPWHCAKLV